MTGDAEGLPLRALIGASRRLDELSTARVIGHAAEAVHKAQKGGQPLGTLTPAGIVVRASGEVALEGAPAAVSGTGYAAPERLRGSPGDRRSDVFSLGVLLWEALAHERLFAGASEEAVKAAVMAAEFRVPSACNANVPAELDAICKKALARDPADRYQSARVMAAEISAVLDDAGYPETNEALARYVDEAQASATAEMPAPVAAAEAPVAAVTSAAAVAAAAAPLSKGSSVSAEWTAIGRSTLLGVVPVQAAPETPVALEEKRREETPAAAVPVEAKPAEPRAKSPTAPSPEPRAKSPTAPSPEPRAKSPTAPGPEPRPKTPTPSSLPSWAHARAPQAEPAPVATTLRGVPEAPVVSSAPLSPSPVKPQPAPEPQPAAVEAQPAVVETKPAASEAAVPAPPILPLVLGPIPGGTVEPSAPSKLGVIPPGAQTALLGSLGAAAEPAPVAAPAPAEVPTLVEPALALTEATDDRARLASVNWHDTPVVPFVKPTLSEAVTLPTPALAAQPAALPPAEPAASQATALPAASAPLPPSADDFEEPKGTPHPAAAVSLRARSRGDQTGQTGDMLGAWGWGTDSHAQLDEDVYEEPVRSRKRLYLAVGGGAALLLVAVIALAAGGSKDEKAPKPAPVAQAKTWDQPTPPAPAVEPVPATPPAPAAAEAPKPEPAAVEPPKPEPAAVAAVEPPKPEPAKPEPPKVAAKPEAPKVAAKPEPPKPEAPKATPKPEPPKVALKPEPPKPTPKVAAKPEPPKATPKAEPPKVAAKPEPSKATQRQPITPPFVAGAAAANAAAKKPEKPKIEPAGRGPIDPYATDTKKIDPNTAYKTGLQQFARGDSNGALATFKASLAANPGYAPTWRGIGLVYEKIGRTAQARTAFQKYLELAPTAGDAGQIRERMGRLQ